MEQRIIIDMTFDDIVFLLRSSTLDKDTYLIIYQSLTKVIRRNFRYNFKNSENKEDEKHVDKYEQYKKLVYFLKNLIILKKVDLIKIGLETAYDINENIFILYDLAHTFFENGMLKEYYGIVTEYNRDKYFINEGLTERVSDMFIDIEPNKIYYLIIETAIFALKNKQYQLMKFIVDTWISKENFSTKGMSDNDMEQTTKSIDLLNNNINKIRLL